MSNKPTKEEIQKAGANAAMVSSTAVESYCLGIQEVVKMIEKNPALVGATNLYAIQPLKIVTSLMMEQARQLQNQMNEQNFVREITKIVEKENEDV